MIVAECLVIRTGAPQSFESLELSEREIILGIASHHGSQSFDDCS
jgi:hypothetical protein